MNESLSIQTAKEKPKTHKLKESIEDTFIENLFIYRTPVIAARKAGYSESTAKNITSLKLRNPKFLAKIKDRYNGNATLILPNIFKSESRSVHLSNTIVSELSETIENTDDLDTKVELTNKALNILAKTASTRKELKQTAGVLATEGLTTVNLIKVEKIQALMQSMHADKLNNEGDK